jgi:uncharacterized membrane protein YesL
MLIYIFIVATIGFASSLYLSHSHYQLPKWLYLCADLGFGLMLAYALVSVSLGINANALLVILIIVCSLFAAFFAVSAICWYVKSLKRQGYELSQHKYNKKLKRLLHE